MQAVFDKEKLEYRFRENSWNPNATEKGILAYKMLIQTGRPESQVDIQRVSFFLNGEKKASSLPFTCCRKYYTLPKDFLPVYYIAMLMLFILIPKIGVPV